MNLAFPLYQREQFTVFGSTSPFWDTFARYDSGGTSKASRGTATRRVAGGRSNIAYFPVYPLLMRCVGRLFGRAPATFYSRRHRDLLAVVRLAMVALYHLARLDLPRRRAERAVLLTMIFPFSFFFGVVYSESTFLLFTVLAFYGFRTRPLAARRPVRRDRDRHARARHHDAAGARLDGVAERASRPGAIALGAAAGARARGAAASARYCLYIYQLTGNPLEWAATLAAWGYYPGGAPWMAPRPSRLRSW